jgi:hypothetical protein
MVAWKAEVTVDLLVFLKVDQMVEKLDLLSVG